MSKKKPAKKAPRDPVPQPHGGALVPGAGGGPQPGSGRPPNEFKARCRELASSEHSFAAVERILKNAGHPAFMAALKWATEQGYTKETLTLISPEITARLQRQTQIIASRPAWTSEELLDVLGAEVWR
jgi:hypothetical protein